MEKVAQKVAVERSVATIALLKYDGWFHKKGNNKGQVY
jgi:hypothetical protein